MGLEDPHMPRVTFLREHTEKSYGTRGSGRVAEIEGRENDSPSVQWGLVLRKILAMLRNPSPWLTTDAVPALVSPVPPSPHYLRSSLPTPAVLLEPAL